MEVLFALILTVFTPNGHDPEFVVDFDLTEYDCLNLAISWDATIEDKSVAHIACRPQS